MVVGERNHEEGRNGRRSRGPSPNGHSDDSSSDDSDHGKLKIFVKTNENVCIFFSC